MVNENNKIDFTYSSFEEHYSPKTIALELRSWIYHKYDRIEDNKNEFQEAVKLFSSSLRKHIKANSHILFADTPFDPYSIIINTSFAENFNMVKEKVKFSLELTFNVSTNVVLPFKDKNVFCTLEGYINLLIDRISAFEVYNNQDFIFKGKR